MLIIHKNSSILFFCSWWFNFILQIRCSIFLKSSTRTWLYVFKQNKPIKTDGVKLTPNEARPGLNIGLNVSSN